MKIKNLFRFVIGHFWTIALLCVSLFVATYVINTQRAPGAMTVIEAQAMDMTSSKPPVGVQPVAVEAVSTRVVEGNETYPASIEALTEEDVMARVPGRVSQVLVYNGDRVRAGQLLATIEANEYAAQANEAKLMASSKLSMSIASMREVGESQAMLRKSEAALASAKHGLDRMQADLEAMSLEQKKAEAELGMNRAELKEREADVTYTEADLDREKKLYKAGAISLDELQMATKERDMALARVRSAKASVEASAQMVEVSKKKVVGAKAGLGEAKAMIDESIAERDQSKAALIKAKQMVRSARIEAESAKEGAKGMSAMADYRQVRALSDGVVVERVAAPGSVVMMGQPILKLKVVNRLRVQAELPQILYSKVTIGTPVTLIVEGQNPVQAKLTSITPTMNMESRTFKVEAIVSNAKGSLASGMYAKLTINLDNAKDQLAVKSSAIRTDSNGETYVWLYSEKQGSGEPTDWTCTMHLEISEKGPGICPKCKMDLVPRSRSGKFVAEKRSVTIGGADGDYTVVTSGLAEGDKVIWAGHENLQPGTPVQETKWGDNGPSELPGTTNTQAELTGIPKQSEPPKPKTQSVQAKWTCPMHPEVVSDKPGSCPKCGMDLVKEGA